MEYSIKAIRSFSPDERVSEGEDYDLCRCSIRIYLNARNRIG